MNARAFGSLPTSSGSLSSQPSGFSASSSGTSAGASSSQGLTLVHFSAQLEPCPTHTKYPTHL